MKIERCVDCDLAKAFKGSRVLVGLPETGQICAVLVAVSLSAESD